MAAAGPRAADDCMNPERKRGTKVPHPGEAIILSPIFLRPRLGLGANAIVVFFFPSPENFSAKFLVTHLRHRGIIGQQPRFTAPVSKSRFPTLFASLCLRFSLLHPGTRGRQMFRSMVYPKHSAREKFTPRNNFRSSHTIFLCSRSGFAQLHF
jgi:hypothetical protein